MQQMKKPSEERASVLDACRAFDEHGDGYIKTNTIKESILKSLDLIPEEEVNDLLTNLRLDKERNMSYKGVFLINVF